ncbi:DUF4142 domain-containing protein [Pedobacter sp. SYSU D00535]|uniref:DUF4142 domain-containing protein n=1 Tax=Pedobacter sp. SYSU D00535 TaxID=2810308 RepID=UPI001A9575A1|nr:DUF4142 domain-containing protein [Pedobacter sp. SYSU D00535]
MKKQGFFLLLLLIGSTLVVQSCKDDDDDDTMDRQEFTTQASASNLLEVSASALADTRSSNQTVRNFAAMMVSDHTQANAELQVIASAKGLTLASGLTTTQQQQVNSLSSLSGSAFDKAYMSLMVSSHQNAVQLFDSAEDQVNDGDLRTYARNKLPALRAHLELATSINTSLNP